jgi:hypothetical protein
MIFFLSMGEIASAHRKLSGAGSAGDNLYDNEEEEEE